MSVRGSGRLWSSSEGSDRTDGAAVWMPEAGSSSGVNDRRTGSQPPAGDHAFS